MLAHVEGEELLIDANPVHGVQRLLVCFEMLSEIEEDSLEEVSIVSVSMC